MRALSKKLASAVGIGCLLGVIVGVSCSYLLRRHPLSSDTSSLLPQTRSLYTMRDLVASGHNAVTSFLESHKDSHGNSIAKILKQRYSACVRVENRHSFSKKNSHFSSSRASGVIVGGGKFVLTAGHLFDLPEDLDLRTRIILTTGQLFDAELYHLEYDKTEGLDLAILKIDLGRISVSPVEMAEARVGQTVFTVGYLQSLGLGQDGALQGSMPKSDKASNYLEPLVQVGRVQSVSERIVVVPTVGCTDWLGLSGAPVLDEMGNLVGIFVGRHRRRKGQGEEYTMDVTPVITGKQSPVSSLFTKMRD